MEYVTGTNVSLISLLHASIRLDHLQGEGVKYTRNTEVFYMESGSTIK
jgi:hypothetical protein